MYVCGGVRVVVIIIMIMMILIIIITTTTSTNTITNINNRTLYDMAGGGGGGGRIAVYGQSITNIATAKIDVTGGRCGVYKSLVNTTLVEYGIEIRMNMRGMPLSPYRLQHIGE